MTATATATHACRKCSTEVEVVWPDTVFTHGWFIAEKATETRAYCVTCKKKLTIYQEAQAVHAEWEKQIERQQAAKAIEDKATQTKKAARKAATKE